MRVAFLDLTITNGYAAATSSGGAYGGAIYAGSGIELTFSGCTISSSTATYGSGIYMASSGVLNYGNLFLKANRPSMNRTVESTFRPVCRCLSRSSDACERTRRSESGHSCGYTAPIA